MSDLTKANAGKTLAQRIHEARVLLHVHGYLRDSESHRIRDKLEKDWAKQTSAAGRVVEVPNG